MVGKVLSGVSTLSGLVGHTADKLKNKKNVDTISLAMAV